MTQPAKPESPIQNDGLNVAHVHQAGIEVTL